MDNNCRDRDETNDDSGANLLSEQYLPRQSAIYLAGHRKTERIFMRFVPWLLSLVLSIALIWSSQNHNVQGFWKESDFGPVAKELPPVFKQVLFKANLRYNESHKLYRPIPEGIDYVGPVTDELEAAWDKLIGAVEIVLTHDEAKFLSGNLHFDPGTGDHRGFVTAHHDLHCLNMIRQYIHKDKLPHLDQDYTTVPHVDHCIDALRETLMCHSDMTIIPLRWSETRGKRMPDYEVVHTCRDYYALRDWSLKRAVQEHQHGSVKA